MRNLKLKYCQSFKETVKNPKFLLLNQNVHKSSMEAQNNEIYIVTQSQLFSHVPGSQKQPQLLAEVPDIVGAEYLALENGICLATSVGEVLLVNPETQQMNEGTFCDVGIECMAWSPDQEVVVFVTKEHNVVVMTCTFDPLTEHSLADENSEVEGEFVNVGWGKKETQFHGSEGKEAAKRKQSEEIAVNLDSIAKDIVISWRADGAYFVVSYVSQSRGRTFKVFDKEGKLQFVGEKQANLFHPTAWRPSGTWIAIPQQLPNKSTIALFEKNGLRHREIPLTFDLQTEPVEDIKWSSDSEILSIKTEKKIYLYTIGNYHWYLKQVLDIENQGKIASLYWDNRIGEEKTLHILFETGKYLIYKWFWDIDRLNRTGLVGVIDGNRLLFTDFSKAIIPPPMCTKTLIVGSDDNGDSYITTLTMAKAQDEIHLCVYDSKNRIHYYRANCSNPTAFSVLGCLQLNPIINDLIPLQYGNLQWFESFEDTYLVTSYTEDNTSHIHFIAVNVPDTYKVIIDVPIKGCTISALVPSGKEQPCELFYQTLEDNRITQLVFDVDSERETSRRLHLELNQNIDQMETFVKPSDAETYTICLSNNQCLFVNNERIATDVTSFCMAGNYLAFTKLTSLHFLRLADMRLVDERRLERGAKLVTTVSESDRTVLQMPRGNLEVISPRVLSLELVGALLEAQKYNAAFSILRKQRINLNIICDHNMCDFVNRLDVFLQQIDNPNWLNLFLSDLQNEDFTKTMYASNYKEDSQRYPESFKIEEKIVYVCKAMCVRMEQSSEKRFRLPIITAYVKLKQLEKALELIWEEKKKENNAQSAGATGAEEALKYLLYLVDVNELYNVALGTYDFGLVLFVAQKSQKDPKEFLAFLNELKGYELNYRKFKIDEHLKRYEKALYHIVNCGKEKFEEALDFIKRHEYYAKALTAFKDDNDCYRQVCLAFADHLRANGKLENASILYERGGNLQQALLSAKHTLDWQRALMLAKQSEQNVEQVAMSLIIPLQEQGRYEEAYELSKNYGNNIQESLQCLIKGHLFVKAIFEAQIRQSAQEENLLENLIIPEIVSYQNVLKSSIVADEELFKTHKQRLIQVRLNRAKQSQLVDDHQADIDECDLISDTTSLHSSRYTASSRGTGKTFRSSKNRRKHERKLLSLKPGNPFEDIALIDALYNQIMRCFGQQQHIRDTCKALLQSQQDTFALDLQNCYKHLLRIMQESLDEIWIEEMLQSCAQQFLQGPNIDYTQLQNEQRYAMISPIKRFKPQLNLVDWEHDILQ
ncbi:elongator complex protein 1 [Haematobia irritans]|uniref:elongator complex protein 1 n=1 Tax=Haematobia irritans TaxID=7368 RepID=UPI003F502E96